MAAEATPIKVSMVIKYQTGVDGKGKPKYSTQKFSKVNFKLSNDDFKSIGQELVKLLDSQSTEVHKEEVSTVA